jgi:hypothetical protein
MLPQVRRPVKKKKKKDYKSLQKNQKNVIKSLAMLHIIAE